MIFDSNELLCTNLLTTPKPEVGTILVTGATGYVGGRLVPELLARGYKVKVMARVYTKDLQQRWPQAEIVVADALNLDELNLALKDVKVAYYLIHSLLLGPKRFEKADILAANNFRAAAEKNKLDRIIYLGALGDKNSHLSPHLRSRLHVAEVLQLGEISTTVLRAAIIIGSGSASYEILKSLVKNTPILFLPYWAKTKCQPISIRTLINILVGVLETEGTEGQSYDVGGFEILTYERLLKIMAKIQNKKRLFVHTSFSNFKFYSYIASFLTPVPAPVIKTLFQSGKNEVLCNNEGKLPNSIYKPVTFKETVLRAMTREELDKVHTRWSDEYPRAYELAIKLKELEKPPYYISAYSLVTSKRANSLFSSFCKIGGDEGWFNQNWMWKLRGILDSILLGVGTSRGRRSMNTIRIHDVVGFFRVEELEMNKRLLLRAEMKLPGKAWLEFKTNEENTLNRLTISAYFEPDGWKGKVYWYNFLPFHHIIFSNLIKNIERRS